MSDRKVTQLSALTNPAPPDLLLIVDDVNGTPTSKKITLKALFGSVSTNTAISANLTVSGNRALFAANVQITKTLQSNSRIVTLKAAPSTNNTTTEGWSVGEMRIANNFIYLAVNATTIRRAALNAF